MAKPKRKIPTWLIVAGVATVLVACAVPLAGRVALRRQNPAALQTAEVTAITAVSSVESSGSVEARQTASVYWQTTGQVAEVVVEIGDQVKKGDVLMTLDLGSVSASVIQAESSLLDAQTELDELFNPSAVDIAKAQQTVSDAEDALETAQKELRNLAQPDINYYEEQVAAAQADLVTAQQNAEKTNIGSLSTALQSAKEDLETKTNWYNDAQTAQALCPGCTTVFVNSAGRRMSLADAEQAYNDAVNAHRIAELNYQQGLASSQDSVDNAKEALADALANLTAARAGPAE
ncbi:MAG: biotin/lipoyl-binding protein, partial [Anaerolineales bacterium]